MYKFWRRRVEGHLDDVRDNVIFGWAFSRNHPRKRLLVDVFVGGRFAGQALANLMRADLLDHGFGDGRHGFELSVAGVTRAHEIRAVVALKPRVELRSFNAPAKPSVRNTASFDDYIRDTFCTLFDSRPVEIKKAIPETLGRHAFDPLFAESSIPVDPPILGRRLCGYLDYQRHKWEVERSFEAELSEQEYEAFLSYYIGSYTQTRRPLRTPLSKADIEMLNRGPCEKTPFATSTVQRFFAEKFGGEPDASCGFERGFQWAIHNSRTLGVEDCLVAQATRKALRALACMADSDGYPLSRCMARFLLSNPFLRMIDVSTVEGRKRAYFAILLFATKAPHLLLYIPEDWLKTFLEKRGSAISLFDEHAKQILLVPDVQVRWLELIAASGFDIERKEFLFTTQNGHRLEAAGRSFSAAAGGDIQIVGPFSRRLGVAQSCHNLADALEHLPYSVRLFDFTRDHPNAIRDAARKLESDPVRCALHVLHLNLEDIPGALAYLPDVFTGSYLVAFPYIELPFPGPAQLLGLSLVDEIWSASDFSTRALSPYAKTFNVGTALRSICALGKDAARGLSYEGVATQSDFVFLTAGDALSGGFRKNPLGVIRAFLHAFPDDPSVRLVIKLHSLDRVVSESERRVWRLITSIADQVSRIIVIDRILSEQEQSALLEGADCFVSLHRAEGFGYHIAEAMALGVPTIATAYSGNLDFCSDETCFLVAAKLVHIEHYQYPRVSAQHTWAEPDFAASVAAMKAVRNDIMRRERVSCAAQKFIQGEYSTEAFAARVDARLRTIGNERGLDFLLNPHASGVSAS